MSASDFSALQMAAAVKAPAAGFPAIDSVAYAANSGALATAFDMHANRFPGYSVIAGEDDKNEALTAWRETYATLVGIAKSVLGPEAHCNDVDPDSWGAYSDCYKSDAGFRPRGWTTAAEVDAYFAARPRS